MFTGLVQASGRLERCPAGLRVRTDLGCLAVGDSVAVDGVCLTVAERFADGFRADVSEETLRRSTLAERAANGGWVNLEPALRLSDRLGGHLVSGHVDGLGEVAAIQREAGSWRLEVAWLDPAYGRYVCEKASVAVDGISLTVAGCEAGGARFWIAVIPTTWSGTTLQGRRVGDRVNLEADLLAKYTERLLQAGVAAAPGPAGTSATGTPEEPISREWLAEHGWG
jgi:riboflavin synthase